MGERRREGRETGPNISLILSTNRPHKLEAAPTGFLRALEIRATLPPPVSGLKNPLPNKGGEGETK